MSKTWKKTDLINLSAAHINTGAVIDRCLSQWTAVLEWLPGNESLNTAVIWQQLYINHITGQVSQVSSNKLICTTVLTYLWCCNCYYYYISLFCCIVSLSSVIYILGIHIICNCSLAFPTILPSIYLFIYPLILLLTYYIYFWCYALLLGKIIIIKRQYGNKYTTVFKNVHVYMKIKVLVLNIILINVL